MLGNVAQRVGDLSDITKRIISVSRDGRAQVGVGANGINRPVGGVGKFGDVEALAIGFHPLLFGFVEDVFFQKSGTAIVDDFGYFGGRIGGGFLDSLGESEGIVIGVGGGALVA